MNTDDIETYVSLEYLGATLREPPERALHANEHGEEETPVEPSPEPQTPTSEVQYEDPTGIRWEITNKLIKTLRMHFAPHLGERRNQLVEQALCTYHKNQKIFGKSTLVRLVWHK